MFTNVKVGDRVWCFMRKWGTVVEVGNIQKESYPILVNFDNRTKDTYTKNGVLHAAHSDQPILFWDEINFEIPKKPLPKLEVDTKVLVWDVDKPKNKLVRYFCSFDASGRVVVFQHGTTSFSCEGYTEIWSEWEVYKEHESE